MTYINGKQPDDNTVYTYMPSEVGTLCTPDRLERLFTGVYLIHFKTKNQLITQKVIKQ
ncbi:MAG: T9SS type A sorting domain-containing protein [Candidatus Parvibacillus calidus]|nr:MAG: T9SS type A sorting domain-containing protein [Candidatus Parvibacillus calidus]